MSEITTAQTTATMTDCATQSNYLDVSTKHLDLDWTIDWDRRLISGSATHTFDVHVEGVEKVILDTSYLEIKQVEQISSFEGIEKAVKVEFSILDRHPVLGSALVIRLGAPPPLNSQLMIRIVYSTTAHSTALGWLEPAQTASGRHPFLYSQCQAIHCRSLVPIQDTPSVKMTYSAKASSYLPVLFSARPNSSSQVLPPIDKNILREWTYHQPVKMPSYLLAVAAGELVWKKMGPRTGVWADPLTIDAAHAEFAESTERFVSTAEKIVSCPYDWGKYDVLVLPPSFPYGGMENSNLTFLTPSLLTGDKSLVDVVAHEISHSWFGNDIGCANWGSFWLNEGWTTYLERLIMREVHGEADRAFSFIIGRNSLQQALEEYEGVEPRFQQLEIPYKFGEDPDIAFSSIPYDKGANFLLYLERTVGGLDVFLPYVAHYVQTFKGASLDTTTWKKHLFSYFETSGPAEALEKLKKVDWEAWLHGQGLHLPIKMEYDTSLADAAYELAKRWDAARNEPNPIFSGDDIKKFNSNQVVLFLETLSAQDSLPENLVKLLDEMYHLDQTLNQEIRLRWYSVALKSGQFTHQAAEWVKDKGRMKFCRPTYKAIYKVNSDLARSTFKAHQDFYHPICRALILKDLGLEG